MASRDRQAGGYDCNWLEEPPDDLKCQICHIVARDPLQHGNGGCGQVYCESCVSELNKRGEKNCPFCRKHLTTFKDEKSKYTSVLCC